jgi:hypothetical protein
VTAVPNIDVLSWAVRVLAYVPAQPSTIDVEKSSFGYFGYFSIHAGRGESAGFSFDSFLSFLFVELDKDICLFGRNLVRGRVLVSGKTKSY